jgi:hypothetical protein
MGRIEEEYARRQLMNAPKKGYDMGQDRPMMDPYLLQYERPDTIPQDQEFSKVMAVDPREAYAANPELVPSPGVGPIMIDYPKTRPVGEGYDLTDVTAPTESEIARIYTDELGGQQGQIFSDERGFNTPWKSYAYDNEDDMNMMGQDLEGLKKFATPETPKSQQMMDEAKAVRLTKAQRNRQRKKKRAGQREQLMNKARRMGEDTASGADSISYEL